MPPKKSTRVFLSLGSNLGDSSTFLEEMRQSLNAILDNMHCSPLYSTEPVGVSSDHGYYLNQVVMGLWSKSAQELLRATQEIEIALGRSGKGELQPRTADIDILLFGEQHIDSPDLVVPHHAFYNRRFHLMGVLFLDEKLDTDIVMPGESTPLKDASLSLEVRNPAVEVYI